MDSYSYNKVSTKKASYQTWGLHRLDLPLNYPITLSDMTDTSRQATQAYLQAALVDACEQMRPERIMIISDVALEACNTLSIEELAAALARAGFEVHSTQVSGGESLKSLDSYGRFASQLAQAGLSRKDLIIALGGGTVGDFAGFAAATYMRGINIMQVPSTLLAMVDASIGGKCALNIAEGKNLIGAFWQPAHVVICPGLLRTLPAEEFKQGCAEIIKHACIADAQMAKSLAEKPLTPLILDQTQSQNHLYAIIERNLHIKAQVVAKDEKEGGLRKILNFGHSLGHGFEAASSHELPHGLCVAQGMLCITAGLLHHPCLLACLAKQLNCSLPTLQTNLSQVLETITQLTCSHGLYQPERFTRISLEDVVRFACSDKKATASSIDIVVVTSIGSAHILSCSKEELTELLYQGMNHVYA